MTADVIATAAADRGSRMEASVVLPGTPEAEVRFTSVSQVQSFELCARKWWFEKVVGVKVPSTARQEIGVAGHSQIEAYLTDGDSSCLGRLAAAGRHFLPTPGSGAVEVPIHAGETRLVAAGVVFRGFVDFLNTGPTWRDDDGEDRPLDGAVEIVDWKFMSDLRWAKTAPQLADSRQMIGYAAWAFGRFPNAKGARLSHGSFQTLGAPAARKTSCLINAETVKEKWYEIVELVAAMKLAARAPRAEDVAPTYSACGAFGGCPHRAQCPRTPGAAVRELFGANRRGDQDMSLLDKYRKKSAVSAPITAATVVAAEVEKLKAEEAEVRGVLPPDAPVSEPPVSAVAIPTTVTVTPEIASVASAWVAPPMTTTTPAPGPTPLPTTTTAPAPVKPKKAKVTTPAETTTATTARVLFVDVVCSGVNPTPLEPYVNGLVQKICAEADVADLRFAPGDNPLGFGRWKGALAAAVRQSPPEPGEYLLLDVRESEIRQVVVEALQPLCTRVVRGR